MKLCYTGKLVNWEMLILHLFYKLFQWPRGHLGAMFGGLEGDLGPPGAHLGTS